jgi:mRNA-degrading endonuclease RelE of RelBE toxin-antitoxin system
VRQIEWTEPARADVRRLDKARAMRIFEGLRRFLETEEGDVKVLQGSDPREYRLRVGDYRVRFAEKGDTLQILRVLHRSQAYR